MPNKKKKYSARFPPARIKKIMQKDDEVGKVAAAVPVIISRSLELFVESLIKKTNNLVLSRNARTLTPQHIKQTVLVENEFKFLHELVATIPDVQSTEDEQAPPSSHQPPLQEVSAPRPILPDPVTMTTLSTTTTSMSTSATTKPGGKQRGRPRKIKPDDVKQSRPKKPKLATNAEDYDSEETCSGSEDENKEFNDQSKQKSSAVQKSISSKVVPQYLPAVTPATLPSTILFNAPIITGPNNHIINNAFPLSLELPNSSKLADAYMTLNGTNVDPALVTQQLVTAPQNLLTTTSNEEVLDLSTGKNGDLKLKKDIEAMEVGHQNALLNKALPIPRTFYMTSILNANVQTMSHPNLMEGNKLIQNNEAYKLNIPKISIPMVGTTTLIKPDLMSPPACRPSLPHQNFTNATRPMGSPPSQISYQIQNLAQKGHQSQIIFSQVRPEVSHNVTTDAQFFGAGSPVRLLQYPSFVSMVPGNPLGGLKLPNSNSAGSVKVVIQKNEDPMTRPDNCATKDGQS